MPVNTIPYDSRPSAYHRGGQTYQSQQQQRGRKSIGKPIYAGSNKIRGQGQMTTKENPWVPYALPAKWSPTVVTPEDAALNGVYFTPSTMPETELESALATLMKKQHTPFGRRWYSNPSMWGDALTPADMKASSECAAGTELGKMLACAPERKSPSGNNGKSQRRAAVVIDTESVQTAAKGDLKGRQDLAAMCAVDLFTGEVLFNVAVLPDRPVTTWIRHVNGIVPNWYHAARRNGNIVHGLKAAQELLFRYVDADTVLVGHSFTNEQRALYLPHARVYDTQIECKRRGDPCKLSSAAPVPCQSGSHSALEDTLATRELALMLLGLGKYKRDDESCGDSDVSEVPECIDWSSDDELSSGRASTPGTSPERPAESSARACDDGGDGWYTACDDDDREIRVYTRNPYDFLSDDEDDGNGEWTVVKR